MSRFAQITALFVLLAGAAPFSLGQGTNTWTGGAGDNKWDSGGNWSNHHPPTKDEDVVIPPDQGTIRTDGNCKKVKSLTVQPSNGHGGTTIQPDKPGATLCIEADGDVTIGSGNTLRGSNGNDGQPGGDVNIKAGGAIINDGTITGGDGGSGNSPKPGGNVGLDGRDIRNNGSETGGEGGSKTGRTGKGQNGGNVTNTASDSVKVGTKTGGTGGKGNPDDPNNAGGRGKVGGSAGRTVACLAGDHLTGSAVVLSAATQAVLLANLPDGAIQADNAIFVDAGQPENPVVLSGIPAGQNALIAGESICIRGQPILDPGVFLADITQPDAVNSGQSCLYAIENVPWHEDFDVYPDGRVLQAFFGWKGWDNNPASAATVTSGVALSPARAVDVLGVIDQVHEFAGADADTWIFRVWQYVPGDFQSGGTDPTRGSYVVLLNTYHDGGPYDWSVQLHADSDRHAFIRDGNMPATMPLITDRWVEVRVVIDLTADACRVYYNGAELGTAANWTAGVYGGGTGIQNLAALDLYANGSSSVFYDELSVTRPGIGDLNCDGAVDFADINPFVLALSDPAGYEAAYPGCELVLADTNGDGSVSFADINPFVALLSGT